VQRKASIIELIRQLEVPLFGTMNAEDLAAIVPFLHRRNFAPNQLVFSKGDQAEELYLLLSGRMKISVLAPDGRELAFRTAGPGQMVGEIAVLDGGTRTADMTSLSQSEVLVLGKASLARLIADRPAINRDLVQFLCQRLRDTTEQLESIALYRIEARLARFMLALSEHMPAASKMVEVPLLMSQTELGAVLGASRPKVNVALHNLEEAGAIRRHGSRMTCDIAKLMAITEDIP
jgi:CRP/FNR family transcriptional regulator, cyclic AMP receptor protein